MSFSSEADGLQVEAALTAGDLATARALVARIEAERASLAVLRRSHLTLIPAPRTSEED